VLDIIEVLQQLKNSPQEVKEDENLHFFGHILTKLHESKSQYYQDIWVLYETLYKTNGFFVDFGATDGVTINNSFLLENKYGWTGILAEPNPIYIDDLRKNRKSHIHTECVYVATGEKVEFICTDVPDISTVKGFGLKDQFAEQRQNGKVITVNTITLYDLLNKYNAPNEIDYLSIDTEGTEYGILNKFFQDNDKYTIKLITIEHNYDNVMRENILKLMTKHGYIRKFPGFSGCDDFYIKEK